MLAPTRPFRRSEGYKGFSSAFLTRMLFSCLVDADFLETERFYAERKGEPVGRGGHVSIEALRDRLRSHMRGKLERARRDAPSALNALRADVLDHAVGKSALSPGLFTLTVPTGGGKTLASLSFALEHTVRHRLHRIVYVIPFAGAWIETRMGRTWAPRRMSPPARRGSKRLTKLSP